MSAPDETTAATAGAAPAPRGTVGRTVVCGTARRAVVALHLVRLQQHDCVL